MTIFKKHSVFLILFLASIGLHVAVVAKLVIPVAKTVDFNNEILVTLQASPSEALPELEPEPEPRPEQVVVTSAPIIPVNVVPVEFEPMAIPDESIPPIDESHEIPITDYSMVVTDVPLSPQRNVVPGDPTNEGIVQVWLERHKRYPRIAVMRRIEGEAVLYLRIDARGNVIDSRIESSSGSSLLDEAVMKMVERSNPFPLLETEQTVDTEYIIPIEFQLE